MNWEWLQYIYLVSLIFLIFGLVWKWIIVLPFSLLQAAIGIDSFIPINILNVIGNYLLVSFIALYGLGITQDNGLWYSILIFGIGVVVYILQTSLNVANIEKEARMNGEYELIENLDKNMYTMILGFILYILIIFIPQIGINPVVLWFLNTIEWISNIKILGWIIGVVAIFNTLNILFMGLISVFALVANLFSKEDDYFEAPLD